MGTPMLIDLTQDSPVSSTPSSSSSSGGQTIGQRRPHPRPEHDAPKPKRRVMRPDFHEYLSAHIVPVVREITRSLSPAHFKTDDIGTRTIVDIISWKYFKLQIDVRAGVLTKEELTRVKAYARQRIEFYKANPDFRVQARPKQPAVPPPRQASTSPQKRSSTPIPGAGSFRKTNIPTRLQRHERVDKTFEPLARPSPVKAENDNPSLCFEILERRPYCCVQERSYIRGGARRLRKRPDAELTKVPTLYHVDFSDEEVASIVKQVCERLGQAFPHTREGLLCLSRNPDLHVPSWVNQLPTGRTKEDIRQFCSDLLKGREASTGTVSTTALSLQTPQPPVGPQEMFGISPLLLARELEGNTGYGRMRRHVNFQKDFARLREDGLDLVAEYTDCAGDIDTFAWVSNEDFVCGATTHSDTFNQQYNKKGNLLFCSAGELKAYPDHRTERPLVEKGENSSEAMRRSQDPWIYPSVVASDYDPILGLAYTASFDKTVKVWKIHVDGDDRHMECLATWEHDGIVNFVKCAKDGSGRVATASNCVNKPAVRIYTVEFDNVPLLPEQELSCSRKDHIAEDGSGAGWAYYPATMQWGRGPLAQHLLAVGYSPRADSGHDSDIPEDKQQTGEITLWDAIERKRLDISNATTANVFEIIWHPTLPRFACATTRCGFYKSGTRTQVHIFKQDFQRKELEGKDCYLSDIALDCPACDINEVTYMPNSLEHAYVTAACTDGRVYVWDTAFPNSLLYVLRHGQSLEIFDNELERREVLDTGVKFTAWGTTLDRFYTGGSDGVVNVWNLQDKQKPFVRKLLPNAPAPISGGAFSPDMQKLAIGDATGRVWVFSVDKRDEYESHYRTNRFRPQWGRFRGPMLMISHPDPPPPPSRHEDLGDNMDIDEIKDSNDTDITPPTSIDGSSEEVENDWVEYAQRTWLDTQQLKPSGDPLVGMVQGPNYLTSGHFFREAHFDNDPSKPLIWEYQRMQRTQLRSNDGPRRSSVVYLTKPDPLSEALRTLHIGHKGRDRAQRQFASESATPSERKDIATEMGEVGDFTYESEDEI